MIIEGYIVLLLVNGKVEKVEDGLYGDLKSCATQTMWPVDRDEERKTVQKRLCAKISGKTVGFKVVENE